MTRTTIYRAITEHTDKHWPADHPLRKGAAVVPDDITDPGVIICSNVGNKRIPPPAGVVDVECTCKCGQKMFKRNNAPPHLVPICYECYTILCYTLEKS